MRKDRHRGTSWKHSRRGSTYEWLRTAKVQTSQPINENDEVIVYRDDKDVWWVRPVGEFFDGRFKKVLPKPPEANSRNMGRLEPSHFQELDSD